MEHGTATPSIELGGRSRELSGLGEGSPWPDKRLVEECLEGNQVAWAELIDRYRNLIFSIPLRQGICRDDASEIFQQVCLTLVGALANLRDAGTLSAWLIQITLHECFRWHRKQGRRSATEISGYVVEDPVSGGDAESLLQEFQQEQILRDAVAELPMRCRTLIDLLFFTTPAVPYEEVAQQLKMATGSVGFTRMRCLEHLRKALEEKGFR